MNRENNNIGQTSSSDLPATQEHEITHRRGAGQRKRGLRAAETEIANRRLGVRNPQEFFYPARRSSLERYIVKGDKRTTGGANANL